MDIRSHTSYSWNMMKTCSTCKTPHSVLFFNKDRSRPDGLFPRCKNCSRLASKRAYIKNYNKQVAAKRRWKAEERHKPHHRAQARAYRQAYAVAHPDFNK